MASPARDEGLKQQALQARSYLERHELLTWMQDILQNLLKDQPDDPWDFIEANVRSRRTPKLPSLQDRAAVPTASPTTKAKAHTLLPLIGNLQKLEAEQQERREELASLLARQPPRPSTKEEADRRALIQANLKSLEELKSDVRVLSAEHEKLQQVQTQPMTTRISQAGSFGSYYAAHVAGALGPAELPRLYEQFRTQRKKAKKQRKEQAGGQPLRSPPPFGASGSFGRYYAAHVATALVPAQLPRLYQQFGFQPGVEARMQLQEKAGGQPSPSPPLGASGPFGSYYAAHVATALVPAQLPRLYQQFGFQPGVEARPHLQEKAGGQPSRSPPPFGAFGSFSSYYAAHVATALMPAQLPRLYQKFGVQPGVEAGTPLQEKAGGQPSRSPPPFGAAGSFGSYYAAHVATALVPEQLPRLYQQFAAQPGVEARTPLQEKAKEKEAASSRSTAVGSARSHSLASSRQGSRSGQPAIKKLPLAGVRPGSESTARSSSVPEVQSRRSRPSSAVRQQMDSRQRKTREALQQLADVTSVPISKSAPELPSAGKGSKAPAAAPQARRPPQPPSQSPSQPPAPREASKPAVARLRSERSPVAPPQRRAEPARLEPLPSVGRQRQNYDGPSLRDEMRVRDELGKLFSTSK